ncbi:Transcription factor R-4 [Sesamum angolense]|uniref:Transcription factor R-4 n=1 Tax=Sesamum angolense TaxID=2727404 RepID=A0AAE2BXA9_9LAMI|nr:Transcription factor R-4 [Sesamum angolense]
MESDRTSNNKLSDGGRNFLHRARPLHGRTSGPTRRSTKGQWTAEEDEILRMAVQRFKGKNWKKIAECFKDRTDVQCLHRWQKVLNPELVKGPWSKEEDEIIIELVSKYGPKKWSTIAQHLPGRIGKQCRERWHNHLNPNINKEAWTQEEELALIRAHQIYGNKWAELTKFLRGRTDNAIKNHWNSSVKKKLDMYLASGLLSQFQGLPLVSHPNHSAASSSSRAQQSSEDDSVVKGEVEVEEASECSQGSTIANLSQPLNNAIAHPRRDCRGTEESGSIPYPEDYCPTFQEATFGIPEVPCELDDKFLEHDFPLDWGTFAGKDWQLNANELPDMSLLDLGQESSGLILPSVSDGNNHEAVPFQQGSSIPLGASISVAKVVGDTNTSNPIANSDYRMVYPEADLGVCCPPENVISDIDGLTDSLLHRSSNFQIPEDETFASQSCYMLPGNSVTQPLPLHTKLPPADASLMFSMNPHEYRYSSHENAGQESIPPSTHDRFIYSKESDCSPCEDNSNEAREAPKLVPANDFVLAPCDDSHYSSEDKDIKSDQQKESGALFYEPPRFPSLDIPFFSCDLIQSGSDMNQEYSPLGIRQLMISSMTPFKLWDSPSRDDSPVAVLKSAAKTFTSTPSILKKRHRDLVSPLSEKRYEKKLEGFSKQESFSNLTNDFSRLEVMFDECMEKKGPLLSLSPNKRNSSCKEKENAPSPCGQAENEGNENIVMPEIKISIEEFNSSDTVNKTTEQTAADVRAKDGGNDVMEKGIAHQKLDGFDYFLLTSSILSNFKAREFSGILVEHDMNDLTFFSPDRFGIKNDRAIGLSPRALGNQYSRRLDAASKSGAILSSSETSCFSVICSPRLCTKKDRTNLVISTSLQSLSPSDKKAENSRKGVVSENNSIFVETPFKRSIESPSAWKSPWFINTFVPGPRIDTDITIEDIGYFLSPGDRSYDAIGLMKQLGEQTAGAFADAQEVLGDETPETIMKGQCSVNQEGRKENNNSPSCQAEYHSALAANFMTERRTLDFSECATPAKETGKSSNSVSFSSPSSYLLKDCRLFVALLCMWYEKTITCPEHPSKNEPVFGSECDYLIFKLSLGYASLID